MEREANVPVDGLPAPDAVARVGTEKDAGLPWWKRGWARFRRLPRWAQITAWIFVALCVVGAALGEPEEDRVRTASTPTTNSTPAESAAPTTAEPATTVKPPTSRAPTTVKPTTTTKPIDEADRKGDSRNPGALYPGRPDIQKDDHEQLVGESPVRFAGWSVWVTAVEYVRKPSAYDCCGYLRVHVRLLNRDDGQQSWLHNDFSLLRPTGEIYSPATVFAGDPLGISGSLVHGGVVEADVWFSVDEGATGDYYVLWEPSFELSHQGRGVWKATL